MYVRLHCKQCGRELEMFGIYDHHQIKAEIDAHVSSLGCDRDKIDITIKGNMAS